MDVLVTGAYGRCGTAIIDHLHDHPDFAFTYLNRSDRPADHPYGGYDTVVADVADDEPLREAFAGIDAVVHLAAYPDTDGDWSDVLEPNVIGTYNVLEAARDAGVETIVFGSTNHVMGGYELEHAPELYEPSYGLVLDHTDPVRPDSLYGASKSFGEDLGRYYVETYEYPRRFYALRICTVNWPEYDHPYGDAEQGVDEGRFDRGSAEYERWVARMKATWQSRRDFAHLVECCLRRAMTTTARTNESADRREPADGSEFDVFSGVSDNRRRWFDVEHARVVLGYDPQDDAEEWEGPPA